MDSNRISVLVVDDSALMRNLVGKIIESADDLLLAGKAMNGKFALNKLDSLKPDVIVLDLEMPEMNGIEFLQVCQDKSIDIPVIVLSAVAKKGAKITMDALALGAVDFIMKPQGSAPDEVKIIADHLIELVRTFGNQHRTKVGLPQVEAGTIATEPVTDTRSPNTIRTEKSPALAPRRTPVVPPRPQKATEPKTPKSPPGPLEIVAIGISTGGPNALRKVFAGLPEDFPVPILVVQHMPAGFTLEFARSLDRICKLEVKEGADGDIIKPGRILIAPGDHHITVEKKKLATILRLNQDPPVNGHRPSADVLFESVCANFGNRSMGIIMTGMGRDGAEKLGDIYVSGGYTIGQDDESSIVYGMPRVAFEYGHVHRQASLDEMSALLTDKARELFQG